MFVLGLFIGAIIGGVIVGFMKAPAIGDLKSQLAHKQRIIDVQASLLWPGEGETHHANPATSPDSQPSA